MNATSAPRRTAKTTRRAPESVTSEADLLAMSPEAYMTAPQLAFFRERLWQLRTELQERAAQTSSQLREGMDATPDPNDQATLVEERQLEMRAREREQRLMKKLDEALQRIADGEYGYCEETGEPIGLARLLARPTATLTVEAQEAREKRQRAFGI